MGNAICSKFPLLDVRCVTFKQDESLMKTEPRSYLAATIEPKKGKRLRVIGTQYVSQQNRTCILQSKYAIIE